MLQTIHNGTMAELQQSINQLQTKSAPGDDQISNAMLKHLPTYAKEVLLDIREPVLQQQSFSHTVEESNNTCTAKVREKSEGTGVVGPLCLTSFLEKFSERLMKSRLT